MKKLLKIVSTVIIFGSSLHVDAMMKELSNKEVANDSVMGIPALSQALQKIDLRAYTGGDNDQDNRIKREWWEVVEHVEKMVSLNDSTYKDLKPLLRMTDELSAQVFDVARTVANNELSGAVAMRLKKEALERLSKKQAQVKRSLLAQKAKSFFSFGKKQDEYKNMRQLLLGMIDMLNAKIDLIKKSVK